MKKNYSNYSYNKNNKIKQSVSIAEGDYNCLKMKQSVSKTEALAESLYKSAGDLAVDLKNIRKSKKIVFTNGCFDMLHPGHIYLLEEAASYGDILVVALNSDSSVRKLKGSIRPLMNEVGRAIVLGALRVVDYVVLFDEETPIEVIKKLKPDVLVKGSEYSEGEIVGEGIVPQTVRVKMKDGYSTSQIIDRINESRRS